MLLKRSATASKFEPKIRGRPTEASSLVYLYREDIPSSGIANIAFSAAPCTSSMFKENSIEFTQAVAAIEIVATQVSNWLHISHIPILSLLYNETKCSQV